jgi:hypothetical protein
MRANRIVLCLLMIAAVTSWGFASAQGAPVLIKLRLSGEADYQTAARLNLAVYHKMAGEFAGEELVVAELDESSLNALDDAGLIYEVVDREPWTESYYLVSESPATEKIDLAQYGQVLVSADKRHFVKISDENARLVLYRQGFSACASSAVQIIRAGIAQRAFLRAGR